ncbi:Aldo/keto reductase [Trichocladium antarcticum]|uniref:Aldo/keto reductase n=1 Tax=Trichocladium antarcticum TaxID=1450529 RepID=A0AAN6UMM4_9PEZI|nr:Aldo/keto reductase [Trichocladium antarcticum]
MATPETTAEMPPMMYGTAWKKERTADLVYEAIKAGFRGIDTAAMKRHYDEALTGEGIPYLDALVLHSPYPTPHETLLALHTLQSYLPSSADPSRAGQVRRLGLSNVTLPALVEALPPPAATGLSIVQNRFCAAEHAFDRAVRAWCAAQQQSPVAYQGFWTLTGNRGVWDAAWFVRALADGVPGGLSRAAAWYVLVRSAGVVVLNGTGDVAHMREDQGAWERVAAWRAGEEEGARVWERCVAGFRELVG